MTPLDTRRAALKKLAHDKGNTDSLDFRSDRGDDVRAAVAWGHVRSVPADRALLLVLTERSLGDTAADDVLGFGYQAPMDSAREPVIGLVDSGGGTRISDPDPREPHQLDQLPGAAIVSDLHRFRREWR